MRKVNVQIKYFTPSILAVLCMVLMPFLAKADVVYATPLKGVEHQIGNLLEWSTALEKNSQTFIVEKSLDGIDFTNSGMIEAAGSSSLDKSYRFLDVSAYDNQSYYRLKQIDADGTSSYTETILVEKELSNQFMIVAMSNTVTNNTFDITIDAINNIDLKYTIKNKEGELISKNQQELYAGLNDIQLNLLDEKEGPYFILLQVDQEEEKLVVQKVDDPIKKKENIASKPLKKGG